MPYDEGLAERIRHILRDQPDLEEKRMFGGLCFMVSRHMCCGILGETLMARVGPKHYQTALSKPHTREMTFTGKPMNGMVYVDPEGLSEDENLTEWLQLCLQFISTLPPK